jgi:WD40 repeat protein/tetratricopeptide (TPR) repeat protein
VQRYLHNEPVQARPPSTADRLRKFVRRNRGAVAAAAAVASALVLGLGAATFGFVRATRATGRLATSLNETGRQKQEAQRQQRSAEEALARGTLSEADALDLAGRWGDADARYREAFAAFDRLGQSTLPVEFSMLSHYAASPPPLVTCRSERPVPAAALSPDGRTAFSAGVDLNDRHVIQVWDLPTGREVRSITVPGEWKVAYDRLVAWSPDARVVISGGDNAIQAVDTRSGEKLWTVRAGSPVWKVAFSADGARFVVLRSDGIMELREARTGRTVREIAGPGPDEERFVLTGRFCLDDRNILSAARDGSLTLWDLSDGRPVRSFAGHKGLVHAMDVAPDGRTAVTASSTVDKTVRVWDLRTGGELRVMAMPAGVGCVAISPDGRTVACGAEDGVVTVLDLGTAKPPLAVFRGHGGAVDCVAFSRDGRFVLSGGGDKTAKLWDVRSANEPPPLSVPGVTRVALAPDGRTAASADADRTVRLWDLRTGCNLRVFRRPEAYLGALAFSPDGRTVAAGGTDGIVKLWDASTGKAVLTLCGHPAAPAGKARTMPVAFSPDGATLLSGGGDGPLKLWDLKTGTEVRAFRGHTANVSAVAFAPDGRSALSAADDKTVRLWDVRTGAERRTFAGYATEASCVRFSADGLLAVAGEFGGGARVLDLQSGQTRQALELDGSIADACLSPDGGLLAIAGWGGGAVRVFDARTGREGRGLAAHRGSINDLAYTSAATLLLTSSGQDGTVRWWDLHRPREYIRLAARAEAARQTLSRDPQDAAALARLGEWFAFRGVDAWAVELLEKARAASVPVSPMTLADCYTRLCDEGGGAAAADAGYADKAAAALREALAASAEPTERVYLQFRLDALLDAPARQRQERGRAAAAELAKEATDLANRGEFRKAADAFTRAREADGDDLWHWFHEGCLLAYLRDETAYEKLCKAMLARFADPADTSPAALTDATTADRVAKTCLLLPGLGGDVRQLSALADRPVNARFAPQYARWFVLPKGLAEYRRGDFQGAAETLGGPRDKLPLAAAEAAVEFYLAMTLHRLGRSNDARAAMSRATELVEREVPRVGGPGLSGLDTWLTCQIARREAEELMGTAGGPTGGTTQQAVEPSRSTAR